MPVWRAKRFQLTTHNFISTAILIDGKQKGICYKGDTIWKDGARWSSVFDADWEAIWTGGEVAYLDELPNSMILECPNCGDKKHKDDKECDNCGIIYEKYMTGLAKQRRAQNQFINQEMSRSYNQYYFVLTALLLIIGGTIFWVYQNDILYNSDSSKYAQQAVPVVEEKVTSLTTADTNISMVSSETEIPFVQVDQSEKESALSSSKPVSDVLPRDQFTETELISEEDLLRQKANVLDKEYETLITDKDRLINELRTMKNVGTIALTKSQLMNLEEKIENNLKLQAELKAEILTHNQKVIQDLKNKLKNVNAALETQ